MPWSAQSLYMFKIDKHVEKFRSKTKQSVPLLHNTSWANARVKLPFEVHFGVCSIRKKIYQNMSSNLY